MRAWNSKKIRQPPNLGDFFPGPAGPLSPDPSPPATALNFVSNSNEIGSRLTGLLMKTVRTHFRKLQSASRHFGELFEPRKSEDLSSGCQGFGNLTR